MQNHARTFERTRTDHSRETAEDYVELILRLESSGLESVRNVDLVNALGVAQPTVTKALDRLRAEGLVESGDRRQVLLTQEGRELAEASLARHKLVVKFLMHIGVPGSQAEMDAEGIEHHVSEITLTAMGAFLAGYESRVK